MWRSVPQMETRSDSDRDVAGPTSGTGTSRALLLDRLDFMETSIVRGIASDKMEAGNLFGGRCVLHVYSVPGRLLVRRHSDFI